MIDTSKAIIDTISNSISKLSTTHMISIIGGIIIPIVLFLIGLFIKRKIDIARVARAREEIERKAVEEYVKLQDNKGLYEIEIYWGDRKRAFSEMEENLKHATKNIFIAGIALRTVSNLLRKRIVIENLKKQIETRHSTFTIEIIACDTPDNAKRIERRDSEIKKNVKEGKELLRKFRDELYKKLEAEKTTCEGKISFLKIKKYSNKIAPRHFILRTDDIIYFGSYLHKEDGLKSYIMRLKRIEETEETKEYIGLYNLFQKEIDYLSKECQTPYNFNDEER